MSVTIENPAGATAIRPYTIPKVPEAELEAPRTRIAATRWPDRETVTDDSQGVPLALVQEHARYWTADYDLLLLSGLAAISGIFSRSRTCRRSCNGPGRPFRLLAGARDAFGAAAEHDGGGGSRLVVAPPGWAAVALPGVMGLVAG